MKSSELKKIFNFFWIFYFIPTFFFKYIISVNYWQTTDSPCVYIFYFSNVLSCAQTLFTSRVHKVGIIKSFYCPSVELGLLIVLIRYPVIKKQNLLNIFIILNPSKRVESLKLWKGRPLRGIFTIPGGQELWRYTDPFSLLWRVQWLEPEVPGRLWFYTCFSTTTETKI